MLTLSDVTYRVGGRTGRRLLDHANAQIFEGAKVGLVGRNGAGKTTLFRLLMGILKATRGRLLIDGLDAFEDRVAAKRLIGFLPDEPVFYSYLAGRRAVLASAGFFAVYHEPLAWLPVALLGVTNAVLFKRTGRLAPAVLLHMTYNAVVILS